MDGIGAATTTGNMRNAMTDQFQNDPIQMLQSKGEFATKSMRKLARFVITKRYEIPSYSIADVSKHASVSQTTVVRLCKELGFTGYRDFRAAMHETRGHRRGANLLGVNVPSHLDSASELETVAKQVTRMNADVLADTFRLLDYGALEQTIELMLAASHVYIIGFGSSAPVALDLSQRLARLGLMSSSHSDPHITATISAVSRPGSLLFGISFSGTTRDVVECLEAMKESGQKTVALSCFASSPASTIADVSLVSALPSADIDAETISARISQLAIIDILIVSLILRKPRDLDLVEALEIQLDKKRVEGALV